MTKESAIKLFEQKHIKTHRDDEREKWYFSVVDGKYYKTDVADTEQLFRLIQ